MPHASKAKVVTQIHTHLDKKFGGEAWNKTRIPSDPLDNLMRTICQARTPHCATCIIADLCQYNTGNNTWSFKDKILFSQQLE